MTTEAIIAASWKALERLRKLMKNKEVFDIVHEVEAHQKELESKVIKAEAKIKELETEIARLEESHSTEIARLREKHAAEIAKFKERDEKTSWHGSNRSELETRILLLLAENSAMETEQIRLATEQGVEANKYHLDEMFRARLIKWSSGRDLETFWHLSHNGRAYLVQRGLIK